MNEDILVQQNKVIISLLARTTIGVEYIMRIVTGWKKKGKPEDYLKVYNALDGTKSIADLAKMVGVTPQGLGQVLLKWEENGIVYRNSAAATFQYVGLLKLPEKLPKQSNSGTLKFKKSIPKEKISSSSSDTNGNDLTEEQERLEEVMPDGEKSD